MIGETPAELSSLASLRQLYLERNQLTGEIPAELGDLANLDTLYLRSNQLTGCIPQALLGVPSVDYPHLGQPFCDVLLSGLTMNPGSLIPSFDLYHTEYTAAVGQSRVTAVPANDHNASFLFLDENDGAIADADAALGGHRVEFSVTVPGIKIRVVSEVGQATHGYTVADLGIRYDANDNGLIGRDEAITAIVDYFNYVISRYEVIGVIK